MAKKIETPTVETPVINAEATTAPVQEQTPVVNEQTTSPELEKLRGELVDAQKHFAELVAQGKFGSKDMDIAGQNMYKIGKAIEAEESNIKKQLALQDIENKKNARLQILKDMVAAYDHANQVDAQYRAGHATMEQSNDANAAYKQAYDRVANELTAKFANSTPRTANVAAVNGEGRKAGVGAEILERYKALIDGKPFTQELDTQARKTLIKDEGYNDGTVGIVVLKYLREQGLHD